MAAAQEFIARIYQIFNARQLEEALALMHPDVVWPNGMEGGYIEGRDAVREYWTNQWRAIDPRVEPVAVSEEVPGRIRVDVRQVVRDLQGQLLADRMVQHVYQIDDGLIRRMDIE